MRVIASLLVLVTALSVLRIPATSATSDLLGIYALVERVVMEPDEKKPERIQLWGAFAMHLSKQDPKKGFMYFRLPESQQATALKEWADLKAIAGTGRVVSFGSVDSFGNSQANANALYYGSLGRIRSASEKPQSPDDYKLNVGVYPVTNPTIIDSLKKALKN